MARVAGGMGLGRGRGCGPLIPLTTKNQGSPAEEREGGWGMVLFGEWELRRIRMGGLGLIWKGLQTCSDGRDHCPNLKYSLRY